VVHFANNWFQNQHFIIGQIKLDSGRIAASAHGATIPNPALSGTVPTRIVIKLKSNRFSRNLYTRPVVYPLSNTSKRCQEKFLVEMRWIG
jgi:hypothetical protein